MQCEICTKKDQRKDLTYLSLYVVGSEGLYVCLECRLILTGYVRTLKSLVAKSKMLVFKIGKQKESGYVF